MGTDIKYSVLFLMQLFYSKTTVLKTTEIIDKIRMYQKSSVCFRRAFGINDHIQCLKTLIRKANEYNKPPTTIFVKFYKAST